MSRSGIATITAVVVLAAGFTGYWVANGDAQSTEPSFDFTLTQRQSDVADHDEPPSKANQKIALRAIQELVHKCPELSEYHASIDPKSMRAMIVVKDTHTLMRLSDTQNWTGYIDVRMYLKNNVKDLKPGHQMPGQFVEYYLAGGSNPGIKVQKGLLGIADKGQTVCGQKVTADDLKMFHREFIADANLGIINRLR